MVTTGTLGTAGIDFDVTETDLTVTTGTVTQEHVISTEISQVTIATTDLVYSVAGTVGTTVFTFDLNSINNQSGTGYSTQVIRNNDGNMATVKMLVIYNTHASNSLIYGSPASNSFFTWGATNNTQAILPGQAAAFVYSSPITIGSNSGITLLGSSASTSFQIYVLGT